MTKNCIIKVATPGYINLINIKLTPIEKLFLYMVHDANPTCTVGELYLYVDIAQTKIVPLLNKLLLAGYITVDGNMVLINNCGKDIAKKTNHRDSPEYQACIEIATELSPAIASAYHVGEYNVFSLAATLYKIHTKMGDKGVPVEVLRRAGKWIALHVVDPGFPVIHNPYLLFNKWGYIVNYKRKLEAIANKPRNYL